jgi:TorA maturation chaperone TorD
MKSKTYVKAFLDPDLAKEWKKFARDYPYLLWVRIMNIKDVKEWKAFIKGRGIRKDRKAVSVGETEGYAQICRSRRDLYWEMTRTFTGPSPSLAGDLLFGALQDRLERAWRVFSHPEEVKETLGTLSALRERMEGRDIEALSQDLRDEHLKIFYDTFFPWLSCYESVYRSEKQIMGDSTMEVKDAYREAGFRVSTRHGNDPPDDLKLELEFMYRLCEEEIAAWKAGEKEEALRLLEYQKRHLVEHMVEWIPFLCEDLIRPEFRKGVSQKFHAEEEGRKRYQGVMEFDFFRAMGLLLQTLLEADCTQIGPLIEFARSADPEEMKAEVAKIPEIDSSGEILYLEREE